MSFLDTLECKSPFLEIYKAAYAVLFYTGIRKGELLALTPADIDRVKNTITISKTFDTDVRPPKTAAGNRTITAPPSIIRLICWLIDQHKDRIKATSRIFQIGSGRISSFFRETARKSGIPPIRLHDLRHSHASLLIEKGFSIVAIKERLGHENIQVTLQTYSHLYPNKQEEISATLESIITK